MQNLKFDEGYKEFSINGDESKVIRFNPTDVAIIERFAQAEKNMTTYMEKIKDYKIDESKDDLEKLRAEAEAQKEARLFICEQVDYIFDNPVSLVVFGNQSPLSPVGGKLLFERFLDCVKPVIEADVKKENEASQKRINKYRTQYHK